MHTQTDQALQEWKKRIEAQPDGELAFKDFMAFCLYDARFGYYTRASVKIGKDGDFYTSSSVGPWMGHTLGNAVLRLMMEEGWADERWRLVEWGGGNGRLASHLLASIREHAPDAFGRLTYVMVEKSPYHRSLQQELLAEFGCVVYRTPEEWLDEPSSPLPTFVISNELLDAFPVHRLRYHQGRFEELWVRWEPETESLAERYKPVEDPALLAAIREQNLPERERQLFELNTEAPAWIETIAARLQRGALITIDYGDLAEELYGTHRMHGTFMCYRKHVAHDDPYASIGEQDLTAHVNFSACLLAGERAGLLNGPLETQRVFLAANGLLERLQAHDGRDPFSPEARANRAIRQLLLSDQMSELFKVLIQRKRTTHPE